MLVSCQTLKIGSGGFKSCLISRILSYGLLVRLSFNKEFIKGYTTVAAIFMLRRSNEAYRTGNVGLSVGLSVGL